MDQIKENFQKHVDQGLCNGAEWKIKLPFKSRQFEYLGQAKFPKYIDGLLNVFAQLPSCVDMGVL